jgi:hypothetical protein
MPNLRVINDANSFPLVYTKNSLSLQFLNTLSLFLSKQENVSVIITRVLVFAVILRPGTVRNVQSQKDMINTSPVQLTAVFPLLLLLSHNIWTLVSRFSPQFS